MYPLELSLGPLGILNTFRGYGGLHFANVTFGGRESNVTISAGYAYVDPGFENSNIPNEGTYINSEPYVYSYDVLYPSSTKNNLVRGPIFSIAGIKKVGTKASFFFDSMIGVFTSEGYTAQTTQLAAEYWNPNPPYEFVPGSYQHVVTHTTNVTTAFFIMPGMRFQSSERRAFQVSLAGVTAINKGEVFAFPVPMCTWFFKF